MMSPCKNCKCLVHTDFPSERMCVRFDELGPVPGHNDKWLCMVCNVEVCVNCYITHTSKSHPELYSGNCESCGTDTSPEDFRGYHWCVKCNPDASNDHSCVRCKPWLNR